MAARPSGTGKVLVVGAGIAGASAAYFLALAGLAVTVIDTGRQTASHVPSALLNPVRGQSGQVDPAALEGLALTWSLVADLSAQGHSIPHARSGVVRPVPDARTYEKFVRHLPPELEHHWQTADAPLAAGWFRALWLPQAGWLDGQALCAALLSASGAEVWQAEWHPDQTGSEFTATFFCGGSYGATLRQERATHRMGSLLLLDRPVAEVPLSFGAYLSPDAHGGVLGGTFEAPSPVWREPELPLASLGWLLQKGAALSDLSGVEVRDRWTGSRLSGLFCGRESSGTWRLTGLGSKGFLLGPLLARRLVGEFLASGSLLSSSL